MFLLSAWVFLSVIWWIKNQPYLGKPFETIPWKVLVVPVVINITGSPLQPSPGLGMEKVSRPCLTWSQPCEPVSFLFHLTLMASCYLMRLRLLTAGPGSSSSEQKWALWTQHFEGSLNDSAGADPGSFHARWKLSLGKQYREWCTLFSFPQTHIWSELLHLYPWLPTTNHEHFQSPWTLLHGFELITYDGNLRFYVCLAEISSGREDSNCLLGDFTSTNSFYIHRGVLVKPKETNLLPELHRPSSGRLQWQQPVYNLLGPFLFSFSWRLKWMRCRKQ